MYEYKIHGNGIHFLTSTVVNWVDVFTRPRYAELIIESLAHCQREKGLLVHAYVIMSNHIHLVVSSKGDRLSSIIRDFKQFTARSIVNDIRKKTESRKEWIISQFETEASKNPKVRHAQFWQVGNMAKQCFSESFTRQKVQYIHQNPVRSRMVYEPHHYVWSSAQDYAGSQGPLAVELLW
ncbi:REP-associated tyrosine transposase [Pontibacter sp. G13]|uniref:REP-associated tyrosine transposase n=1 Tax=Pontibacter sp. G13 TaxID=3074898 RepID=UPI002889B887|nr:transposase [Pontibacter sp. G13]WNJ17211.1 transposase [Pontibacter sp. G13]